MDAWLLGQLVGGLLNGVAFGYRSQIQLGTICQSDGTVLLGYSILVRTAFGQSLMNFFCGGHGFAVPVLVPDLDDGPQGYVQRSVMQRGNLLEDIQQVGGSLLGSLARCLVDGVQVLGPLGRVGVCFVGNGLEQGKGPGGSS